MSTQAQIINLADAIVRRYRTRDPEEIADCLGITIMDRSFALQRGAYTIIHRQPFIFIKADLHPAMRKIVLFHEIAHHLLHRQIALSAGGFQEFELFNMRYNRLEYEANIFAAQASLPTDEVLEYIQLNYDIEQIANAMGSDINLVALKCDNMRTMGYRLHRQDYRSDFLKSKNC